MEVGDPCPLTLGEGKVILHEVSSEYTRIFKQLGNYLAQKYNSII